MDWPSAAIVICALACTPVSLWVFARYAERTYVPGATPLAVIKDEQEHNHEKERQKLAAAADLREAAKAQATESLRERAFGS